MIHALSKSPPYQDIEGVRWPDR